MNIFVLDLDPKLAAQYHNDKHCVKMILESAQMLCTAVNLSGGISPYKTAHVNHPCTVWVRESLSNWRWLRDLTEALNSEFKYRYGRFEDHKSFKVVCGLNEPDVEDRGLTAFALAMPADCIAGDAVTSYRLYYIRYKDKLAKWSKREAPYWFSGGE